MRNLVEKILANRYEKDSKGHPLTVDISKFNRSDRAAIEQLVSNNQYFNQNSIKYIKDLIIDSIMDYGVDTATNSFLYFVTNPKLDSIQVPFEHGHLIQKELQAGDLRHIYLNSSGLKGNGTYISKWLWDKRAYKGDIYKLKALLFLSDTDLAEDYGSLKLRPLEELLNATSKAEIDQILDNWQVASNTDSATKRRAGSSKKDLKQALDKLVPDTIEEWVEYLKKTFSQEDPSRIEKAAKASYKKGKSGAIAMVDFVNELNNQVKPEDTKQDTPIKN